MTSIPFDSMIAEHFSPFEIIEMDVKGRLFTIINTKISEKGWSQKQTAQELDISQPRVSNIRNYYHDKFSIEALMKLAAKLGCHITVDTNAGLTISISK